MDWWVDYYNYLHDLAKLYATKKEYGGFGNLKAFNEIMDEIDLIQEFLPVGYYGT